MSLRRWSYLFLLILFSFMCKSPIRIDMMQIEKEIQIVLNNQVEGWNACDLERFMEGYWKSDSLRFASGGRIQSGWHNTLEGYKKRYPDKKAIGFLTFSEIDIDVLTNDAALVFGRWTLMRESDTPTGLFTLLMKRMKDDWRIVSDHTSSAQ